MSAAFALRSRAVVEDYLARLVAGRDDAKELFADDAKWWVAGEWQGGGTFTIVEVEAVAEHAARWFASPMRFSVRRIIADDAVVAVELHSDATFRDGVPYRNDYVMIYEVREGRIWAVREYLDTKQIADGLERLGEVHPAVAMKSARADDTQP